MRGGWESRGDDNCGLQPPLFPIRLLYLNNGASLYQAIIASEDVDLTASSWYLQDRWLEAKGSKSGAIKLYGDGSQDYINAVLNCEVCLLAHPGDYNYWKKVFDKIQVQPLEGKVQKKCCLD